MAEGGLSTLRGADRDKDGPFSHPLGGSARPPTIPTKWPTSIRMAHAIGTTTTTPMAVSAPIYPGRAPREARRKRGTVPQARTVRARGKGICFPPGACTGLPGNGAGGRTDAGPGCGLNCARRPAFGRLGLPPPPPSQGGQGGSPPPAFRRRKVRFAPFPPDGDWMVVGGFAALQTSHTPWGKLRTLPCSFSPNRTRFAGLRLGSGKNLFPHSFN